MEFTYNDIDELTALFTLHPDQVAAVFMEPVIVNPPGQGYLQLVKELCEQNGALLIFDEIVTGFIWALGGAQEYFKVIPHLATFGKGMANGMPLNAVVGRRNIMEQCEEIFFSTTFGGECLSLAAGLATVKFMRDNNYIRHIWQIGYLLMGGLKSLGLEVQGYPCRPAIIMPDDQVWRSKLMQELAKREVLIHNGGLLNLSYSHTVADIDKALNAFEDALKVIDKVELEGSMVQPAFRRL